MAKALRSHHLMSFFFKNQRHLLSTSNHEPPSGLTHIDSTGKSSMVDITDKSITERKASAQAVVVVGPKVFKLLKENQLKKGDALTVSRLAGIMGAKRTSDLIPLCHPIQLAHIGIELSLDSDKTAVNIVCSATCSGKTGVEMEALSGATIAALALYDMSKSVTHKIVIQDIRLLEKTGGKRNVKSTH